MNSSRLKHFKITQPGPRVTTNSLDQEKMIWGITGRSENYESRNIYLDSISSTLGLLGWDNSTTLVKNVLNTLICHVVMSIITFSLV